MSFEPFIPTNKGKNTLDGYGLNITEKKSGYFTGQINFGGGMQEKLKMTDYKYVDLFQDNQNKLIAIKLTNEKGDGSRAIRYNSGRAFMTCTSWLYNARFEYGYPATGNGGYKILENGLIVLEKPIPNQSNIEDKDKS